MPTGIGRALINRLKNIYKDAGCLDFCLLTIPIKPWPHQLKILRRIAQQFPCNYLIADEVGLGKTIETGLVLRYLLVSRKAKRILILAPASVQPQWQEELKEKFNLHFWSYQSGELKDPYGEKLIPLDNLWNEKDLILCSSHLIRRQERISKLLFAEPWDLIVVDESHHARRKGSQNREDTPNRLLEALRKLKERTRSLILLTATPMQLDPIEVFDLLHLLGLKGQWSKSDNFCDYFDSFKQSTDRSHLEFWQKMSSDYFRQGGKPCSLLNEHLSKNDRLMSYRLLDTWQKGDRLINPKQLLQDEAFLKASRQFLITNTPLKDLMFRHTRDTLRQYYKRGLLTRDIPRREVFDNAISLEPVREVPLYRAVSDYVRHFYNLAQKENRKGLGFLMTLYRRRLTSSFHAVKLSLQRRLDGISVIDNDDLDALEDADDVIIDGLEKYLKLTDPEEIEYLEQLLQQFENTGEDTKLSHVISILRQELSQRESAIIFTQYTDTMDYLRDNLQQLYGSQVACYSGRGGELYEGSHWQIVKKEYIKKLFRQGDIKILLCTKSASEGLNLQTCGVILQYCMPWNPMQVEQQIGRLDRIGQIHETVRIYNFYYDGTVEAKVYRKLRDRIQAFETVVGNLQPILAQVPTFIEQAVMAADPEEEDVLLAEFDSLFDNPPLRLGLEEMVSMNVEADLREINQVIPPSPITIEAIEQLFTQSALLKSKGIQFIPENNHIWTMIENHKTYQVTFNPKTIEEFPSLHCSQVKRRDKLSRGV